MSITSSNNSSENNLTPDESNKTAQLCCPTSTHLSNNTHNGHNLSNSMTNSMANNLSNNLSSLANGLSGNNMNGHHNGSYPLYENSNFTSAKKNNFTTILEVPLNQAHNQTSNQMTSVPTNGHLLNVSSGVINGQHRYSINNQLKKYELEQNIYGNQMKMNTTNQIDHYANLPPQYLDSSSISNQHSIDKQFNKLICNSPINHSQSFTNNIYGLQQQSNSSNNSSNNNIFILECQSSNGGSRSGLTTPDSKSNDRLSILSKSQPDLTNLDNEINCINVKGNLTQLPNGRIMINSNPMSNQINSQMNNQMNSPMNSPMNSQMNNHMSNHMSNQINGQLNSVNTNQQVNNSKSEVNKLERIRIENAFFKEKLDVYVKRNAKLEFEIQKVNQIERMYEEFMCSAEKKEKLERAARYKLEIEIRRLLQQNKQLKDQLTMSSVKGDDEICYKKEDAQKTDLIISQLVAQKQDLLNTTQRQEVELQAQREVLEEQRNHIDILDAALMSSQNNVMTLESNLRKKMQVEERANNLQKALNNLQASSERRLQIEKRARVCLEKEIEMLKNGQRSNNSGSPTNETEVERLKKLVREYEEKIINLESEKGKWEQKYIEENTMRQIEVESSLPSIPKENKITALENLRTHEKSSQLKLQQSEKLIAEVRSERLRHMDELHEASKKATQIQATIIKDLESKLTEKEAMIKVLQQHSIDRDAIQQSILAQRSNLNKHMRSCSTGLVNGATNSQTGNNSSSLITRNLKNLSIAGFPINSTSMNRYSDLVSSNSASSRTSGYSTQSSSSTGSSMANENAMKANMENVDNHSIKEFDKRLTDKNSIIRALRNEKERHPDRYFKI